MIIESALKSFYNSDLMTMIQAIQRNITVHSKPYYSRCGSSKYDTINVSDETNTVTKLEVITPACMRLIYSKM